MRNNCKDVLIAVLLAWVLPWLIMGIAQVRLQTEENPAYLRETVETFQSASVKIPVLTENGTIHMDMNEYLTGVLLAELPGSFHVEAKKAQSIVARTYAMRTVLRSDKHDGAICTDSACCQGYMDPADYPGDTSLIDQARQAVNETGGMVLMYDRQLIEATYFSSSGGMTEDAVAVWGTDVPYLQAVESPGEETAIHHTDTVSFSKRELEGLMNITLTGLPSQWYGDITYTDGGGVETVRIGNLFWEGTQVRSLLGLRSTAFTISASESGLIFTTRGYGHRVGMSQYGAQAMAMSGANYEQILLHYYKDTYIDSVSGLLGN